MFLVFYRPSFASSVASVAFPQPEALKEESRKVCGGTSWVGRSLWPLLPAPPFPFFLFLLALFLPFSPPTSSLPFYKSKRIIFYWDYFLDMETQMRKSKEDLIWSHLLPINNYIFGCVAFTFFFLNRNHMAACILQYDFHFRRYIEDLKVSSSILYHHHCLKTYFFKLQ